MQETIDKFLEQNAALLKQNVEQKEQIDFLQQKIKFLLERLFGSKSEKLDSNQLEFLLSGLDPSNDDDLDPTPSDPEPSKPRRKREQKPRMPEDLPAEDHIIDPEEVTENPEAYRYIGEEVTEELDVVPTRYFRRRTIRRKFVKRDDKSLPPVIAPLPPRLIEGGYASVGLLTDIMLKKYVDHLPLYRQEQILRTRFGIELSRKTMSDWVRVIANWLKPIYNHIAEELRQSAYLQVDETPVRYCRKEGGGSGKGYLWVYYHPGGDVLYEWHTSRAATCLETMLDGFSGTVQCDGYAAYTSYAKDRDDIKLAGCWAHARRKFTEAADENPAMAGWFLNQIRLLYRIETDMRGQSPAVRLAARSAGSAMIMKRLEAVLECKLKKYRPTTKIASAIQYAWGLWPQLNCFLHDGNILIDNNGVENTIRPVAIGRKNYMFFGDPNAGQRSAILYTILETCKRHDLNPQEYLHDLLSNLPTMMNTQTAEWTPAAWAKRQRAQVA